MNTEWSTKKLGKIITGVIFVIFAVILLFKEQYGYSVLLIALLLILLKLDELTDFAFSLKNGFNARFGVSKEKIEENIKENNEAATPENFFRFKKIDQIILADLQKKYGGEMKTLVHFMYGQPDRPEFVYTPDGAMNIADNSLYFFEIKYVLKPEFAKPIVTKTIDYLKEIINKFNPMAGNKLVIKLVLVSSYDIDINQFKVPNGIELEFYKI